VRAVRKAKRRYTRAKARKDVSQEPRVRYTVDWYIEPMVAALTTELAEGSRQKGGRRNVAREAMVVIPYELLAYTAVRHVVNAIIVEQSYSACIGAIGRTVEAEIRLRKFQADDEEMGRAHV